jgi:hypothetical protein
VVSKGDVVQAQHCLRHGVVSGVDINTKSCERAIKVRSQIICVNVILHIEKVGGVQGGEKVMRVVALSTSWEVSRGSVLLSIFLSMFFPTSTFLLVLLPVSLFTCFFLIPCIGALWSDKVVVVLGI